MGRARFRLPILILALLAVAQPVFAEGWPFPLPFSKRSSQESTVKRSRGPGVLERLDTQTKKLFRETVNFFRPKPPPVKRPADPWERLTTQKPRKKKSVWESWFGPKDPPPIRSMEDFIGLKRPQ